MSETVEPRPAVVPAPHAASVAAVVAALGTDAARGLTDLEAARRLAAHGPNVLAVEARRGWPQILAAQFASPVVALLALAAGLSAIFSDWAEALAILIVLGLNALIGFLTEIKAERSMAALRALGASTQLVRRDGRARRIGAEELVPGDVLLIEEGDVVTADARLVTSASLAVDESALTGESLPVDKGPEPAPETAGVADRTSMLFRGTAVARGCAVAVVTDTGARTELGRIATLTASALAEPSPLERRLARLTDQLMRATLVVAALIAVGGILQGKSLLLVIETAIALAVAAIPEGLPVVATLVLARGMWRMAESNAVIERLGAVETLGATTVILTDKTGTLTENRMTVSRLATAGGDLEIDPRTGPLDPAAAAQPQLLRLLDIAVLCNGASLGGNGEVARGDPMEIALLEAARAAGIDRSELLAESPEVVRVAFDSATRLMATVHLRPEGGVHVAVKGAPEAVLAVVTQVAAAEGLAPLADAAREAWLRRMEVVAGDGYRVIALAERSLASAPDPGRIYEDLVLVGFLALQDPPRRDVPDAIAACRRAGIRVVMVTGDHGATARTIAARIGLSVQAPKVVEGRDLGDLSQPAAAEAALAADVLARVSPAQKLAIVRLHQARGAVVAMTGDGVNDAPALKKADIGVAMGLRGTEVARQAAAMVLRDDAFPTIVKAVREGRAIFINIRTFVVYLLGCNLSEVLVVGLAVLSGLPLPLMPLQILFLNLVTDVFPAFALAMGEAADDVMDVPPRDPVEAIVDRRHWLSAAGHAAAMTVATLGAMSLGGHLFGSQAAVTTAFLTLALAQLWHVFNVAPEGASGALRSRYVWGALAICGMLLLAAVTIPLLARTLDLVPPEPRQWAVILAVSLVPTLLVRIRRAIGRLAAPPVSPSVRS